jgi:hypothetical protein
VALDVLASDVGDLPSEGIRTARAWGQPVVIDHPEVTIAGHLSLVGQPPDPWAGFSFCPKRSERSPAASFAALRLPGCLPAVSTVAASSAARASLTAAVIPWASHPTATTRSRGSTADTTAWSASGTAALASSRRPVATGSDQALARHFIDPGTTFLERDRTIPSHRQGRRVLYFRPELDRFLLES